MPYPFEVEGAQRAQGAALGAGRSVLEYFKKMKDEARTDRLLTMQLETARMDTVQKALERAKEMDFKTKELKLREKEVDFMSDLHAAQAEKLRRPDLIEQKDPILRNLGDQMLQWNPATGKMKVVAYNPGAEKPDKLSKENKIKKNQALGLLRLKSYPSRTEGTKPIRNQAEAFLIVQRIGADPEDPDIKAAVLTYPSTEIKKEGWGWGKKTPGSPGGSPYQSLAGQILLTGSTAQPAAQPVPGKKNLPGTNLKRK